MKVQCPHCHLEQDVPEPKPGQGVQCPGCFRVIVPMPAVPEPPAFVTATVNLDDPNVEATLPVRRSFAAVSLTLGVLSALSMCAAGFWAIGSLFFGKIAQTLIIALFSFFTGALATAMARQVRLRLPPGDRNGMATAGRVLGIVTMSMIALGFCGFCLILIVAGLLWSGR